MSLSRHEGIAGLTAREPVGAALTIGVKDSARGPTETDRFHLVAPREGEGGRRPLLSAFAAFHALDAGKRQLIRGNIVHGTRAECFEHHLKNQVGPKGAHPDRRPFCVGDGVKATRWVGPGPDDFKSIPCPHDKCEFRAEPAPGKPKPCKPWMRLLFRVRWPDGNPLPTPLVKFTSGSWNTVTNAVGFFAYIENAAAQMGARNFTLFGLPFVMNLQRQTKPSSKTSFPVVTFSPEIDPIAWIGLQRSQLRELAAAVPIALSSGEEQGAAVVASDYDAINVPQIGAGL